MKNAPWFALSLALAAALPVVSFAAVGQTASKPAAKTAAPKPDQTLATVNGTPITRAEFDRALTVVQQGPQGATATPLPPELRTKLLNQLVNQEILYQEAAKHPPKDFDKQIDAQLQALKARFPNPEAFQKELTSNGLTEKALRKMAGRQVAVQSYVATRMAPSVKVTDAEARTFYDANPDKMKVPEQVKASHILLLVPQGTKPEDKQKALAKAKDLQKRASKGEDFAKLAKENSQDPGSKDAGGDLGFFSRDGMVEPFANAAFALKVGQVSDVVETRFGYHVIKLTDRKAAKELPFAEAKEKILAFLKNRALSEAVAKKVEGLRKSSKVKVLIASP